MSIDKDNEDIGWIEVFGPLRQPIPHLFLSNGKDTCLWCGVKITPENDSGWEAFCADGRTMQSICKACDQKPHSGIKEESPSVIQ